MLNGFQICKLKLKPKTRKTKNSVCFIFFGSVFGFRFVLHTLNEEVTIISSDLEPLPRQKVRRVTRTVRFSHPLAYQDPHFL